RFLHDFETLAEFTGSKRASGLGPQYEKLGQLEGGEKVFAAMLVWGEYDIHAGNLGVMKIQDDAGKDRNVLAKIDHGWSATQFFTDPATVLKNLANAYKIYRYQGKLPLNIDKLRLAVDEITLISDDEIERLVQSRLDELKKMGFEIDQLLFWENDPVHYHDASLPKSGDFFDYDALARHYLERYKSQIATMREVSKRLSIISQIDFSDDPKTQAEWKNGVWLQDLVNMDPVLWAKEHGKTIGGLDPKVWKKAEQDIAKEQKQGLEEPQKHKSLKNTMEEIDAAYGKVREIFFDTKFTPDGLAKKVHLIKQVCEDISKLEGNDEDVLGAKSSFADLRRQIYAFEEAQKKLDYPALWKFVLKTLDTIALLISDKFLSPSFKASQEKKKLFSEMKNHVATWDISKFRKATAKKEEETSQSFKLE
ncbi:MAG: hypothetical protein KKD11_04045, partial [Candidatus Omnitrophica bacterium]|nr:hypothetical protein [Candidatus Omnitrophota bacterium]